MTQQKVHFILVSMGTKGIAFRHQAQPGKSKSLKDSYSTLIFLFETTQTMGKHFPRN